MTYRCLCQVTLFSLILIMGLLFFWYFDTAVSIDNGAITIVSSESKSAITELKQYEPTNKIIVQARPLTSYSSILSIEKEQKFRRVFTDIYLFEEKDGRQIITCDDEGCDVSAYYRRDVTASEIKNFMEKIQSKEYKDILIREEFNMVDMLFGIDEGSGREEFRAHLRFIANR